MKKAIKVVSVLALAMAAVMMFAACSSFPSIKSRLEKEGYTVTKVSTVELEEYGKITMYQAKGEGLLDFGIILEGKAGTKFADALKEMKNSEDKAVQDALKAIMTVAENAMVINDNCAGIGLGTFMKLFKGEE